MQRWASCMNSLLRFRNHKEKGLEAVSTDEAKTGQNRNMRDMTDEFGIIPTPKYDEAQAEYIHCM